MNIKLRKLLLPFCHKICSHFCPICTQLELYRHSCFDTFEALESVYDLLIEYEKGVWFPPLNDLIPDLVIDDEILKKMSKELYSELEEETAYLKGNLEATQRHLEDMRTLALKN